MSFSRADRIVTAEDPRTPPASASTAAGRFIALATMLGRFVSIQLVAQVIGVLVVVRRLLTMIGLVQTLELTGALLPLVLVVTAYCVFLTPATAIVATVVTLACQQLMVKRCAAEGDDTKTPTNDDDLREM